MIFIDFFCFFCILKYQYDIPAICVIGEAETKLIDLGNQDLRQAMLYQGDLQYHVEVSVVLRITVLCFPELQRLAARLLTEVKSA